MKVRLTESQLIDLIKEIAVKSPELPQSFEINMDYFTYDYSDELMFNEKLGELFGITNRLPEDELTQDHKDIAAGLSTAEIARTRGVTEQVIDKSIGRISSTWSYIVIDFLYSPFNKYCSASLTNSVISLASSEKTGLTRKIIMNEKTVADFIKFLMI